jgi:hypothetical protein
MQAAATSVALFVTKQYSTVALQYLADTLSTTFWRSNAPDACRIIREDVKRIVPLSEIQLIYALSSNCAALRMRSPVIDVLLNNLNEEAAKIHHELHLIRLAILEYQQPWSQRPYYGFFSIFGRSICVSEQISRIKDAAAELKRNYHDINQWIQTGILLDSFNRQLEQKQTSTTQETTTQTLSTEKSQVEGAGDSIRLSHEQQGKWLVAPPLEILQSKSKDHKSEALSSIQISDPNMLDKMYAITKDPHGVVTVP